MTNKPTRGPLKTILLVDDDEETLESIGEALRFFGGATVMTATSGHHALEALQKHVPDAMVTDFRMPGMNGIELAQRAREAVPKLPVVIITAYNDDELVKAASLAGVCDVIRKPLDVKELLEAVRQCYEAHA